MGVAEQTPLMRQWRSIKDNYRDSILLFRMGDFYETFYEDAEIASRELDIVLTARNKNKDNIPLAGIPYHALEGYLAKLIRKGHKVAICEQVEDPAKAKGLVKREVIRVVTPGTIIEDSLLEEGRSNYLIALYEGKKHLGIACVETSTGEFTCTSIPLTDRERILSELVRLGPRECIVPDGSDLPEWIGDRLTESETTLNRYEQFRFDPDEAERNILEHFAVASLQGIGLDGIPGRTEAVAATGAALEYVKELQGAAGKHIGMPVYYSTDEFMTLDPVTTRNLEVFENIRDRTREGSLLDVLDLTSTSMGGRMLRRWLAQPLMNARDLTDRLDGIEELTGDLFLLEEILDHLKGVQDLERLSTRVIYGSAGPRELVSIKDSISRLEALKDGISPSSDHLGSLVKGIPDMSDVAMIIETGIAPDAPPSLKDGGVIREGYNEELDRLRGIGKEGRQWILSMEAHERERTGIKTLKIGYNKVFGYYIEVSKANTPLVPEEYIRKQTLVNSERYITPELKTKEEEVLASKEKIEALEQDLFKGIRDQVGLHTDKIREAASRVAELDVLCGLSSAASKYGYTRPELHTGDVLEITKGRHPMVEQHLRDGFIPNDTLMNNNDHRLIILTGPNMAGKSTYMRQIAMITLMAHIGSFVPAEHARIPMVDRIFTRVGAFDDLTRGQSTFMVEMLELANILNSATERSLILLDEIGRGTSTFDGLSIAWAVSEYVQSTVKAKTLFATHYHHLTELEEILEGVRNYNVEVLEKGDNVIFLRKVAAGSTNRSFGIHVARMAGVPQDVVDRANEVLKRIEAEDVSGKRIIAEGKRRYLQVMLFPDSGDGEEEVPVMDKATEEVVEELKEIDPMSMTPLEALNTLSRLKEKLD